MSMQQNALKSTEICRETTESDGDKNKCQGGAGPNVCMELGRKLVNQALQLSAELHISRYR